LPRRQLTEVRTVMKTGMKGTSGKNPFSLALLGHLRVSVRFAQQGEHD